MAADPSRTEAGALLPAFAAAGADIQAAWGSYTCLDGAATYHPQGSAYIVTWSQIDGPAVTLDDPGARTPCFVAPLADADLHFVLAADDGRFVATHTVLVQVRRSVVASAPLAAGGADRFAASDGDATATARDVQPVAADVAVNWEPVAPGPSLLLGPAGATATAHIFRLVAVRGGLRAAPDYILVWPPDAGIGTPTPPRVTLAGPTTVAPGAAFTLVADGATAGPLRWHWSQLCGERVLQAAGDDAQQRMVAPRRAQALCFRVTGRDALLESAPADLVVQVAPASGDVPTVVPPTLAVHAGSVVTVVADTGAPLGVPGVTYVWHQGPRPQVALTAIGAQQTFVAPAAGTALALEVYGSTGDVDGPRAMAVVQVQDIANNRAPQVTLCASPAMPAAGATVLLYATVQDPDQDPLGVQAFGQPSDGSALPTPVAAPGVPPEPCLATPPLDGIAATVAAATIVAPAAPGAVSVVYTACDALGACSAAEVTIAVAAP